MQCHSLFVTPQGTGYLLPWRVLELIPNELTPRMEPAGPRAAVPQFTHPPGAPSTGPLPGKGSGSGPVPMELLLPWKIPSPRAGPGFGLHRGSAFSSCWNSCVRTGSFPRPPRVSRHPGVLGAAGNPGQRTPLFCSSATGGDAHGCPHGTLQPRRAWGWDQSHPGTMTRVPVLGQNPRCDGTEQPSACPQDRIPERGDVLCGTEHCRPRGR